MRMQIPTSTPQPSSSRTQCIMKFSTLPLRTTTTMKALQRRRWWFLRGGVASAALLAGWRRQNKRNKPEPKICAVFQ